MKRLLIFFLMLPVCAAAQFFDRLPSARAEAMGRGMVAIDGDLQALFFNPAAVGTIKGIEVNANLASPYVLSRDAKFTAFTAGWRINDYFSAGLSFNRFALNRDWKVTHNSGAYNDAENLYRQDVGLTVAGQPLKKLYVGLTAEHYTLVYGQWKDPMGKGRTLRLNFGALRHFDFWQRGQMAHFATLGAGVQNFGNAKMDVRFSYTVDENERFPITARAGLSYGFSLNKGWLSDSLKTLQFLFHAEYQDFLESEPEMAVRLGGELLLFDVLALRMGFYHEQLEGNGPPQYVIDSLRELTYGIGLQLPLHRLMRIPLNVRVDFARLPQTTDSFFLTAPQENFTSVGVKVVWMPAL